MDKFEVTMQNMMKLPPQEGMKVLQSTMQKCMCGECPTYTNNAKGADETFFCGTGKSFRHITMEVTCICVKCPVKSDLGLKFGTFCMRGSEKTQRYDHTFAKK